MTYTNKEILTSVLAEWLKPIIPFILQNKIGNHPGIVAIENKIKNTGWVGNNWHIVNDIAPLIEGAAYDIISPFIINKLQNVPDELIPQYAHSIVDAAIANNGLSLLDSKFTFEKTDVEELKRYLDVNLPYQKKDRYNVILPNSANSDGSEKKFD